jgi:lysophospholipid acyltransferase (LPLAT)-like uncharacterized protein
VRAFRTPAVQGTLAFLLAAWLRFCFVTIRWTHENEDAIAPIWAGRGGVIIAFWHSRIALSPACWPFDRAQDARAVISLSPDGEFIAKAVGRMGFPAIRGSSSKTTRRGEKLKGGASAFREALRWLKDDRGAAAITPDGPRGPAEVMAEGTAMLAALSGRPVMMVGLACNPAKRLDTWDKAVAPLPFGRGAIVWDGPIFVSRDEDLEALRTQWAERLNAVTARAEALVR